MTTDDVRDVPRTDPGDEDGEPRDDQHGDDEAPAGSAGHRLAVSALIVAVLLTLVACNAPDSTVKAALVDLTRPFMLVTGLDQRWGVFAPNPRIETSNVIVRVERADGTVGTYSLDSAAGISEYWNYRWRKYGEMLWTTPSAERERVAMARWFADQDRAAGHEPKRVALLRITRPNLPPGPGPDTGPWSEVLFSTTTVGTR